MASCTESSEEESEVRLLPPKKKPKSDTDLTKCIICQEKSSERLRSPTEAGLRSFKEAVEVRKDETYHRILSTFENLDALDVVWHGKCFQSYTSKRNLSFIKPLPFAESQERHVDRPSSRSQVNAVDWSLCLFCQQKKSKGTTKLMNVSTFDSCKAIEEAARRRSDESMLLKISGVDLIAAEAKYHKHCRSQYVSKSNLMFVDFRVDGEEDVYTQAFQNLREDIKPQLESGVALDMKTLLDSYQGILQHLGCNTAKSYKSERLKRRLQQSFQEEIVFQKLPDPSKPELVYSSSISLQDVINSAAKKSCHLAKMSASSEDESSNSQGQNDVNSILYHAAQILRSSIRSESKSIGIQPVDVEDISACKVKSLMPKDLYNFLCLMISNPDKVDVSAPTASNAADERHILAIAQDLIYATTHGRVKTPKHIGLAMSVRHMTGSKHLVTMLNRFGHCCSYDDIEVVDTSLALDIIASSENLGAVVPSNISPGVFVQVAGDNNDINEETLDGKQTTHATTLVLYQRKQQGPKPKPAVRPAHSEKRRSLNISDANPPLLEFGACGKRPAVTFYKDKIEEEWFQSSSSLCTTAIQMDFGWFLTRLCTHQLFSENLHNRDGEVFQPLPSWSGFNAEIASEPPPLTSVGYCPMINGSPTEYSTVYTAMKNVQAMMDVLHQKHSVITFDLAIYMKAKEIQWRRPEEFKNTVIRMGGFHIALNFLSVIGKIFQDSGIEDLLIESGVYGCHTASMLLKGKSYNRGVRAHKLVLEALLRLQWQAFGAWMEAEDIELPTVYQRECLSLINCCQRESNDLASLKTSFGLLCDKLPQLQQIFARFCTEASQQSKLFHFWNMYIDIVLLLLRFIRAEREGSWKLHLKAVAEMVPYFFSMDRINYSRYVGNRFILIIFFHIFQIDCKLCISTKEQ